MQLNVQIVSPTKILMQGDVDELIVPSVNGEAGILAQHADYLTQLGPGEILVIQNGERKSFAIKSGFAKVTQNRAVVLVEEAHG